MVFSDYTKQRIISKDWNPQKILLSEEGENRQGIDQGTVITEVVFFVCRRWHHMVTCWWMTAFVFLQGQTSCESSCVGWYKLEGSNRNMYVYSKGQYLVDVDRYIEILRQTLLPFLREVMPVCRFMQDNNPKHTSKKVRSHISCCRVRQLVENPCRITWLQTRKSLAWAYLEGSEAAYKGAASTWDLEVHQVHPTLVESYSKSQWRGNCLL